MFHITSCPLISIGFLKMISSYCSNRPKVSDSNNCTTTWNPCGNTWRNRQSAIESSRYPSLLDPMHRVVRMNQRLSTFICLSLDLDSELVKPVFDSTMRLLKQYAPKILSVEVDRLIQEVRRTTIESLRLTSRLLLDDWQRDQDICPYCEHDHVGVATSWSSITTYPLVLLCQSSRVHLSATCHVRCTSADSDSQWRSKVKNGSQLSGDRSSSIADRKSSNYKLRSLATKCKCPMKPCRSIKSVPVKKYQQQRGTCPILETSNWLQRFPLGHSRLSRWLSTDERRQVSANHDDRFQSNVSLDSKRRSPISVLLVNTTYVFRNNAHYRCEPWTVVFSSKHVDYVSKCVTTDELILLPSLSVLE